MSHRIDHFHAALTTIHEWDVFTFRRVVARDRDCALIRAARYISHSGNGYLYPLVPLLLLVPGFDEPLTFFKLALLAFGIERIIYLFAKNAFKRKRPANTLDNYSSVIIASDEFSFPSGHSSAAFLMVTLLVMFYDPYFAILYLWAAAVAASRVLVGVHFPTDVLVGSLMGFSIGFVTLSHHL